MRGIVHHITEELRNTARELLASGRISAFLGFREGDHPMTVAPFAARTAEEVELLIFNSFCVLNSANTIPELLRDLTPPAKRGEPPNEPPMIGVIATGCWSRNIVVQTQEHQVPRDKLVIVGVASRGMVDRRKVLAKLPNSDVYSVEEQDHLLLVRGRGYEVEIPRWEVVRDNCKSCSHPEAVDFDLWIGPKTGPRSIDAPFQELEEIEGLGAAGRWEWFSNEFSRCIRCYACRNACPLCYCPTCFVDDSRPQWVGKSADFPDTATFHLLRAYHCAGRCTDCGACESVCPMDIPLRKLTKKLYKAVKERFGFEPGLSSGATLPLSTFSSEDREEFILRPGGPGQEER